MSKIYHFLWLTLINLNIRYIKSLGIIQCLVRKLNSKILQVNRYREARAGCLLITCLTDGDQGYALNLGWVPLAQIQETIDKLAKVEEQPKSFKVDHFL